MKKNLSIRERPVSIIIEETIALNYLEIINQISKNIKGVIIYSNYQNQT